MASNHWTEREQEFHEGHLTFKGLQAEVKEDPRTGEKILEIEAKCTSIPHEMHKFLKRRFGLSDAQAAEIQDKISEASMLNYLAGHRV